MTLPRKQLPRVAPKVAHGFNFWPGLDDGAPGWFCPLGAKTVMLSARWHDDEEGFGWCWSVAVSGAGGEAGVLHTVESSSVPIALPECLYALAWWGTVAESHGADKVIQMAAQAQHARRP